ncbi:MAG: hypothetical protein FJX35_24690 [Alphaproteobacteria bacterium]|nr:hypothetical protein [Alphaproteobacteria bacterium]
MTLSIAVELVVIVLLAVTIAYAVVINRRLGILRDTKAEMEKVLLSLDDSIKRAESSVKNLKSTAEQQMKVMQQPIQRAEAMRDELAFIVKRADELADRLTNSISASRAAAGDGVAKPSAAEPARETVAETRIVPAGPGRALRAGAKPVEEAALAQGDMPGDGGRSKAETDLLKALRGLR